MSVPLRFCARGLGRRLGHRLGHGIGHGFSQGLSTIAGLALALPLVGCTVTPDPCQGYAQACVAVTVDSGPTDTYRLLVAVLDGYGSTTPLTPRQQPSSPLVYPLRFAIRFGEFDPFHKGKITFTIEALNHSDDAIGYVKQQIDIQGIEHTQTTVSLGQLPDMPDMPDMDQAPDLAGPVGPVDMASLPEMP